MASDPRVEYHALLVPFQHILPDIPLQGVEHYRDKRLKREDILRILNPSFISMREVEKMDKIQQK